MLNKFRIRFIILLILSLTMGEHAVSGQKVELIKVTDLEKILNNTENKLYIINLWATWCPPCVKELPYFEKVAGQLKDPDVRFILISLDFQSEVVERLIPFLKKNGITLEVDLMTDTDYNSWIDMVDPEWQGNIPSTLFLNNSKKIRYFHPGEISETELQNLIKKFIKT